jgi:hypothetical protein
MSSLPGGGLDFATLLKVPGGAPVSSRERDTTFMQAILTLAALTLIPTGFVDQHPVGRADTTTIKRSAKPPMMAARIQKTTSRKVEGARRAQGRQAPSQSASR